ncbi:MAG: hypothetical protein AAF762_12855 [Pseudomonadota bacterium]
MRLTARAGDSGPELGVAALVATAMLLSACSVGGGRAGTAEGQIAADLDEVFSDIDTEPATACVFANATIEERVTLATSENDTTALTREIFERTETLSCLEASGVIEVLEL